MNADEVAKWAGLYAHGNAATAVAVALAEHGGRVDERATNRNSDGSVDSGIWQINSVHRQAHPDWTVEWLKDPQHNSEAMAVVSNNGTNWQPWTTFRNGAYRRYMPEAEQAVDNVTGTGGPGAVVDAASSIATDPLGAIKDVAGALGSLGETVGNFLTFITDPDTWRRAALIGIGAAIAVASVVIIARGTETGQAVESGVKQGAKKAAAVAAVA